MIKNKVCAFLLVLVAGIFFYPPASRAEATVAVVVDSSLKPYADVLAGFREEFSGGVDVFETAGKDAYSITRSLEKGRYRVVVAIGADPLKHAASLKGVPILTGMVVNPLTYAGVDRDNVSGVTVTVPSSVSLKALKQLMPRAARVGVVYNSAQSVQLLREVMQEARTLDIDVFARGIQSPNDAVDAFKSLEDKVDAFLLIPDMVAVNAVSMDYLLLSSFRKKIPVIGLSFKYVKMGALLAVSFNEKDIGRQLAEMAHRIIKGEPVSSIPFEYPRKFTIDINGRAADNIGINIPAGFLRGGRVYRP